ncbi:hypothetical protein TI04_10180 [Achromatium sp. WMS2]|nr:hypothetical protein TI04_10180 [Achromatium sp. WMS2]
MDTKEITYNGIRFLYCEEAYEIRKNQMGTIRYYTRMDTGESGMSLRGLANGCGVGPSALLKFLNSTFLVEVFTKSQEINNNILNIMKNEVFTKPDIYLVQSDDLHVIRDVVCERIIYYYAFESKYKKTKARELYQSLAQHGLRTFIQNKTGYQPEQAPQHDNSLVVSVEEHLKQEIEELRLQLVTQQQQITTQQEQLAAKDEQIAEQDQTIKILSFRPTKEKTYQAYVHGMLGGNTR